MNTDLYGQTPAEDLYVHNKQILVFTPREDAFCIPKRPVFNPHPRTFLQVGININIVAALDKELQ
jgi:hypothetical protein